MQLIAKPAKNQKGKAAAAAASKKEKHNFLDIKQQFHSSIIIARNA
jgi:hypothetical protein